MDLFTENSPQSCSNIGLDCGTCVHRSAASVAALCRGLDSAGLEQIFFQLYPSPGCRAMTPIFALAYQECSPAEKPARAFASAAA
jgi:hypothetical protein